MNGFSVVQGGSEETASLSVVVGGAEAKVWDAAAIFSTSENVVERYLNYTAPLQITANGVGSWWQLPRSVELNGKLYTGGVTSAGMCFAATTNLTTRTSTVHNLQSFSNPDDHNNPALLITADRPPMVAITEHNGGTYVWKGVTPGDLTTLGAATPLTWPTDASYMQFYRLPSTDTIVLITRAGSANQSWYWRKSTDYGTTWNAAQLIITASDGNQYYIATTQKGGKLVMAAYGHPSISTLHEIRVGQIDIATGAIERLDGTSIGSVGTGISSSSLPVAYTPPAGINTRLCDISNAPDPELLWLTWGTDNVASYRYAKASTGWTPRTIVGAGVVIGDITSRHYHGGASFTNPALGGTVYLSRESSGTWTVEKRTTLDSGVTWSTRVLYTANRPQARPYAPVNRTISGPEVTFYDLSSYVDYTNFAGRSLCV